MPKQQTPAEGETPALRRSARIKNVKTPPVYNVGGGATSGERKRRSTGRKPRTSGTDSSERRKPTKRRSAGDTGRRAGSKRKKASSPVEPEVEDTPANEEQQQQQATDTIASETVEVDDKLIAGHDEEAPESSVSMVVNVPSVLESASLLDDSESELKASMASLLDQTAAKASAWDAPAASSETQAESDQLSQNGIFANVSVTAGDERVFGKAEDEEADFPLRRELTGLQSGAFVFSRRAARLSRDDVTVLLTMDYSAEGSPGAEEVATMAERVGADLFMAQGLPVDVVERLKTMHTAVLTKPGSQLQAFIRNDARTNLVQIFQCDDILLESAVSKRGEHFDRKLREHSKLSVQAFSVRRQNSLTEITIVNAHVNTDMLDVACIELAAVARYMKKTHRDFVLVGNWNAFPPSQEDFGSALQVLLGKPEKSTLVASIPNPCLVHDGSSDVPLISGYDDIFDDIPRNMLLNFDGQNRPASNVWAAGSVKIVAAWQRVNRDCGPSLVAFTTADDKSSEQEEKPSR